MNRKLLKNISITFFANIISMLVSMISTLVIPKLIGTTEYGYWQLYIFYISYAGLLHLGLCDGVYLKYGGREYSDLNFSSLRTEFWILSIYSMCFCGMISIIALLMKLDMNMRYIVWFTCFGAFVHVLRTYLWLILQTTNRLKEYSKIVIADRIVFVVGIVVIALTVQTSFQGLIICDIIGRISSLLIAIFYTKEVVIGKLDFNKKVLSDVIEDISAGINLLIAGIASNFIIGFIRIGIQNNWNIETFGKVSLSLSVINMVLSFISVASIVFFPLLKRLEGKLQLELYKQMDIILNVCTFFILLFAGIGSKLIEIWLPQYQESAFYLILLLPICVYESETAMLLNTYLKAFRLEKNLMWVNAIIMFLSMIFSYITTTCAKNLYMAIVGIDILVLLRVIVLKYILRKRANCVSYKKVIFMEIALLITYLVSYQVFNIFYAGLIYAVVYTMFVMINFKELKKIVINNIQIGT